MRHREGSPGAPGLLGLLARAVALFGLMQLVSVVLMSGQDFLLASPGQTLVLLWTLAPHSLMTAAPLSAFLTGYLAWGARSASASAPGAAFHLPIFRASLLAIALLGAELCLAGFVTPASNLRLWKQIEEIRTPTLGWTPPEAPEPMRLTLPQLRDAHVLLLEGLGAYSWNRTAAVERKRQEYGRRLEVAWSTVFAFPFACVAALLLGITAAPLCLASPMRDRWIVGIALAWTLGYGVGTLGVYADGLAAGGVLPTFWAAWALVAVPAVIAACLMVARFRGRRLRDESRQTGDHAPPGGDGAASLLVMTLSGVVAAGWLPGQRWPGALLAVGILMVAAVVIAAATRATRDVALSGWRRLAPAALAITPMLLVTALCASVDWMATHVNRGLPPMPYATAPIQAGRPVVTGLVHALRDPSAAVRTRAIGTLVRLQAIDTISAQAVLDTLREQGDGPSWDDHTAVERLQLAVLDALSNMTPDRRIGETVKSFLHDSPADIACASAAVLTRWQMVDAAVAERVVEASVRGTPECKGTLVPSVAKSGQAGAMAEQFRTALHAGSWHPPYARLAAADGLVTLGLATAADAQFVADGLTSARDPSQVAEVLGSMRPPFAGLGPRLLSLLRETRELANRRSLARTLVLVDPSMTAQAIAEFADPSFLGAVLANDPNLLRQYGPTLLRAIPQPFARRPEFGASGGEEGCGRLRVMALMGRLQPDDWPLVAAGLSRDYGCIAATLGKLGDAERTAAIAAITRKMRVAPDFACRAVEVLWPAQAMDLRWLDEWLASSRPLDSMARSCLDAFAQAPGIPDAMTVRLRDKLRSSVGLTGDADAQMVATLWAKLGTQDIETVLTILEPIYANAFGAPAHRLWAHVAGGGSVEAETVLRWLARAPETAVSSADAVQALTVFQRIWDSSLPHRELHADLQRQAFKMLTSLDDPKAHAELVAWFAAHLAQPYTAAAARLTSPSSAWSWAWLPLGAAAAWLACVILPLFAAHWSRRPLHALMSGTLPRGFGLRYGLSVLLYVRWIRVWVLEPFYQDLRAAYGTTREPYLPGPLVREADGARLKTTDLLGELGERRGPRDPRGASKVWVQGGSGTGKTSLVRALMAQFVEAPTLRAALRRHGFLPIPVFLRDADGSTLAGLVLAALQQGAVTDEGRHFAEVLVGERDVLLLLDGLNETPREQELLRQCVTVRPARVVILSQTYLPRDEFARYTLPEVSPAFAHDLLRLQLDPRAADEAIAATGELWASVQSGYDVMLVADLVRAGRPLPKNRLGLYAASLTLARELGLGGAEFVVLRCAWTMWSEAKTRAIPDHVPPAALAVLAQAGLVVRRAAHHEFRHDLTRGYLAARWATSSPRPLIEQLSEPAIWKLAREEQQTVFEFLAELIPDRADLESLFRFAAEAPDVHNVLLTVVIAESRKRGWRVELVA